MCQLAHLYHECALSPCDRVLGTNSCIERRNCAPSRLGSWNGCTHLSKDDDERGLTHDSRLSTHVGACDQESQSILGRKKKIIRNKMTRSSLIDHGMAP